MPIYEFHCDKCESDYDLLVRSAKDEAENACPSCGSREVTRLLSTFGVGNAQIKDCEVGDSGGCGTGACPRCV